MTQAAVSSAEPRIRGEVVLELKHWELWGESRSDCVVPRRLGYGSIWPRRPDPDHEGVRSRWACVPRDDDIADAIGCGVTWLRFQGEIHARQSIALEARYGHAYGGLTMARLAKKWGVSRARVSQYWQEGQGHVEAWVLEHYGDA